MKKAKTKVVFNCCVAASLLRPLKPEKKTSFVNGTVETIGKGDDTKKCDEVHHGKKISLLPKKIKSFAVVWLKVKTNIVKSFSGFRSYRVMLYSITHATFLCGYLNFVTLLPFAMFHEGHDQGSAAIALSIAAVSSTSARIIMSLSADRKWFPKFKVYTVMTFLSAVACFGKLKSVHFNLLRGNPENNLYLI